MLKQQSMAMRAKTNTTLISSSRRIVYPRLMKCGAFPRYAEEAKKRIEEPLRNYSVFDGGCKFLGYLCKTIWKGAFSALTIDVTAMLWGSGETLKNSGTCSFYYIRQHIVLFRKVIVCMDIL